MVHRSTLNISPQSAGSWPTEGEIVANSAAELNVQPLRIGPIEVDPPILQAPMAGFTNFAYRQVVREYGGVGLQATEMVNARGFMWLDEHECETPRSIVGRAR